MQVRLYVFPARESASVSNRPMSPSDTMNPRKNDHWNCNESKEIQTSRGVRICRSRNVKACSLRTNLQVGNPKTSSARNLKMGIPGNPPQERIRIRKNLKAWLTSAELAFRFLIFLLRHWLLSYLRDLRCVMVRNHIIGGNKRSENSESQENRQRLKNFAFSQLRTAAFNIDLQKGCQETTRRTSKNHRCLGVFLPYVQIKRSHRWVLKANLRGKHHENLSERQNPL